MKTNLEHVIGIRFLIPVKGQHKTVDEVADRLMPAGNFIATMVLSKLLKVELALDGVEAEPYLGGPLNQMLGFIRVDDVEKGLLVVARVLADFSFTDLLLEIAWWNAQETCWRLHPYGDATEFNKAFGDGGFANLNAQIAAWRKQIQSA